MRRAIRSLVFLLVFTATGVWSVNAMFAIGESVHPDPVVMNLTVMTSLPKSLRIIDAHNRAADTHSVAFLGDSTAIAYPPGQTVHERLNTVLASSPTGRSRAHVRSLSSLGMTPAGFYLLADEITDAGPDIAIVTANLALIRDPMPANLKRPELAGWMRLDRAFETLVSLKMHKFDVLADRLFLYNALVTAGLEQQWLRQATGQARLSHLRTDTEPLAAEFSDWHGEVDTRRRRRIQHRINTLLPKEPGNPEAPERFNHTGAHRYMKEVMAGITPKHWAIEVIRALLMELRSNGVATVLYVPPINLEHFRSVGALNDDGLARTLATLENVAIQTGSEFADLHDLLPDAAFRDIGGHYTHAPPYDGPALVAKALAPYVVIQTQALSATR